LLIPVILAGGVGSRLWPLSRDLYPKQFLPLTDSKLSLLQLTLKRLEGLEDVAAPVLLCNEMHRFLVAEQLRQLEVEAPTIVLEPMAKNTLPAVTLAAFEVLAHNADPVLLILPADHLIESTEDFQQAISVGLEQAKQGKLVTFGITPTKPETGYGYIHGKRTRKDKGYIEVDRFVEKPDLKTAQSYLSSGDYYWNSGMFMFAANTLLEELGQHAPEILNVCEQAYRTINKDLDFDRISEEVFAQCPSQSIDYGIMEKTSKAVVVPLSSGWNDVGAWSALWDVGEQDDDGNVLSGDVMIHDSTNTYVRAESKLVAALGLEDIVIVETPDAMLVADRRKVQNVKVIVDRLKAASRKEATEHTRVYRPWGSYESIVSAPRFQVKMITVNPGAALSLQLHHHRAEHWIVVKGRATVTRGEEEFPLSEDESTYIPIGEKHRLVNPGIIPLELIEVQTGSYLGEDDIVRFDDIYGREN